MSIINEAETQKNVSLEMAKLEKGYIEFQQEVRGYHAKLSDFPILKTDLVIKDLILYMKDLPGYSDLSRFLSKRVAKGG